MSVGHPRGTHLRYVIGCCLIPLGIYGLKNISRRITDRTGCVWGMPSLPLLSSLARDLSFSVRSRYEMFFLRALQLLVIAFQMTEPLNATESFM